MAYPIWQATITDDNGNVLPGAEITVVNETTGLNAALYSTRNGTSKANPFFATVDGFAQFYAAPGLYRITATDGGTGTTQTFRYVRLVEVGTAAGEVMQVGAFGLGKYGELDASNVDPNTLSQGFYNYARRSDGATPPSWINSTYYSTLIPFSPASPSLRWGMVYIPNLKNLYLTEDRDMSGADGLFSNPKKVYTEGNTTVDGNGFIKTASPIVNLFADHIEPNDSLEVSNAEFDRIDVGHYVIRNVPLLSRDGWYIETPKDRNNNIYFTIDYDESVEGELTIRTYEPDYSTGRATNGNPVDIIDGRFVSLRFVEIPELYPTPEMAEAEDE